MYDGKDPNSNYSDFNKSLLKILNSTKIKIIHILYYKIIFFFRVEP